VVGQVARHEQSACILNTITWLVSPWKLENSRDKRGAIELCRTTLLHWFNFVSMQPHAPSPHTFHDMPFTPMLVHLTETSSSACLNKRTGGHFITIKGNFIYQMSISISFRAQSGYIWNMNVLGANRYLSFERPTKAV
jgi:hypothetical protein